MYTNSEQMNYLNFSERLEQNSWRSIIFGIEGTQFRIEIITIGK